MSRCYSYQDTVETVICQSHSCFADLFLLLNAPSTVSLCCLAAARSPRPIPLFISPCMELSQEDILPLGGHNLARWRVAAVMGGNVGCFCIQRGLHPRRYAHAFGSIGFWSTFVARQVKQRA